MSIKIILEECKKGRQSSQKKLFELFYGYVRSICLRYGSSAEDADEMLNDTFYNVFKYLDSYDSQYPFKPWIRKICVNSCLKHQNKYLKKSISTHNIEEIEQVYGEEINFDFEPTETLKLLNQLPPQYRLVLNLYVFEELKHSEIADKLNISVGTSKSNLSRAKDLLKKMLNKSV